MPDARWVDRQTSLLARSSILAVSVFWLRKSWRDGTLDASLTLDAGHLKLEQWPALLFFGRALDASRATRNMQGTSMRGSAVGKPRVESVSLLLLHAMRTVQPRFLFFGSLRQVCWLQAPPLTPLNPFP